MKIVPLLVGAAVAVYSPCDNSARCDGQVTHNLLLKYRTLNFTLFIAKIEKKLENKNHRFMHF